MLRIETLSALKSYNFIFGTTKLIFDVSIIQGPRNGFQLTGVQLKTSRLVNSGSKYRKQLKIEKCTASIAKN